MAKQQTIPLGYELGTGEPIAVPLRHMAVTGQTQQSGKTTTLEALIDRAGGTALTFVTKRGEGSFAEGRRIQPYFRDRADWKFVDELLEAVLQEKNKFLRPWIMRICRTTATLKEVQDQVRDELVTAKGINHGVFTQLEAYLEMVVPEIARADLAESLDLELGLNVMDVSDFTTPMQMLFIQSALDWINARCRNTTVVIPEAWEFVPQGKGSPVKKSAETLVRKGGGLGNHIWLDSQDMAGVDKMVMRACTVWLIGVQREANEIKRNLANIPAGIKRPKAEDIALLERGQFFACFDKTVVKVYVQPAWSAPMVARGIAMGAAPIDDEPPPRAAKPQAPKEAKVTPQEAQRLREENETLGKMNTTLSGKIANLEGTIGELRDLIDRRDAGGQSPILREQLADEPARAAAPAAALDMDAIYAEVKRRAATDPSLIKVLASKPEIEVTIERKIVQLDGVSLKGRVARLIAQGFMREGVTQGGTRNELKRTGGDVNTGSLSKVFGEFVRDGFLTLESGDRYKPAPGIKTSTKELRS